MADRLTKGAIDAAGTVERETYLWDGEIKGFGLRIRPNGKPSGARSFVYLYRPGGGRASKQQRVTIGRYPDLTLDQARLKARMLVGEVAHDRDPAAKKRAERQGKRAAASTAVDVLVPLFVEQHHRARGNRWAEEAGRTLTFDAVRKWKAKPVGEVTSVDITKLLREVATGREAPVQARKLYIALSRFFRWCVAEGHCTSSPMAAVEAPPLEPSRDRVISDAEIRLMWRAAEGMGYPFGPCIQLLILTGGRRNEIAEAERSEFDLKRGEWLLPAARSKNKRAHLRHLSPQAIAILERLPLLGEPLYQAPAERKARPPRPVPPAGALLFSTTGKTAVSGFSKIREKLQASMVAEAERLEICPPADDWTFHDLRRSLVTWLAGAGFAVHVADKLLGHATGAIHGVTAVYQRAEFLPERKAAMLAWGAHVEAVAQGRPEADNVTPMRAGAI